tara:strand:- start:16907 stop:17377 length:471 start_codon:yes stop_codon:yes gene_type:complete
MVTENRGGARVPDGVARPQGIFGTGANQRTDMSELPGTPGTPLPPSLNEPDIQSQKRALQGLSGLNKFKPADGSEPLFSPSQDTQPIQAGLSQGPGPGRGSLVKGPVESNNDVAYQESLRYYALMQRLSQTGNVSQQTKAMLRKMKSMAPLHPYEM